MTLDEIKKAFDARNTGITGDIAGNASLKAMTESLDKSAAEGHLPPPGLWTADEIDRLRATLADPQVAADAKKKKREDYLAWVREHHGDEAAERAAEGMRAADAGEIVTSTPTINYDELTDDEKRKMAGSIVGDDAQDAAAMAAWDAENP